MAGPVKSVADKAAGSFMDTLKGIGTDKVVSEALLGGAAGIGLNLGANVVTGDSGGYTGAAMLGGAAGGLGRAGLKHFNLETQASNLFSTAKGVATGGMTKAQQTVGTKSNKPVGERMTGWGGRPLSIDTHAREAARARTRGEVLNTRGFPEQAAEQFARADAFKVTGKDLRTQRWEQSGQTNPTPERQSMTPSQIQQQRYSPEAKALRGQRKDARKAREAEASQRSATAAVARGPGFDQRQLDRIDLISRYNGNTKDVRRAARQAKNPTTKPQVSWSNGSNQTINMGSMASSATQAPTKPNYKPQQSFNSNVPGMASAGAPPNNFNNINNSGLSQSSMAGLARLQNKDYGSATF